MKTGEGIRISPYSSVHRPQIATLWFDSWLSAGPANPEETSRAALEARLAEEGEAWSMYLAWDGDRLAAFLALDRARRQVRQLFVGPDHQRRGFGAELLTLAKTELGEGAWLRVDAGNTRARRFYALHGFRLQADAAAGPAAVIYRWP